MKSRCLDFRRDSLMRKPFFVAEEERTFRLDAPLDYEERRAHFASVIQCDRRELIFLCIRLEGSGIDSRFVVAHDDVTVLPKVDGKLLCHLDARPVTAKIEILQ